MSIPDMDLHFVHSAYLFPSYSWKNNVNNLKQFITEIPGNIFSEENLVLNLRQTGIISN